MRYWWVNQNQTYKYEVPGGFMWSPFKNANGARNPFYDNMDKVQPGVARLRGMSYQNFLEERRKLMAQKMKGYFQSLAEVEMETE